MTESPAVVLRPAGAADAPFLLDMLVLAFDWRGDGRFGRADVLARPEIAHYVAGWPRPGDLGVVAEAGGRPVGAAWLRRFTPDDPGYGFVAADVPELSIGVRATHRGRGIGRALLRELLAGAAAAGVARVSLSVERSNAARGLYRDEGFEVVDDSGVDSDTMLRQLGGGASSTR